MKKMKIIIIMFLIITLITLVAKCVYATPIDDIMGSVRPPEGDAIKEGKKIRSRILFIIQVVGSIIAVSVLIVLGIKYMVAAPDGKADIKKQAIIYVVGAALLFGASGIAGIIRTLSTSL